MAPSLQGALTLYLRVCDSCYISKACNSRTLVLDAIHLIDISLLVYVTVGLSTSLRTASRNRAAGAPSTIRWSNVRLSHIRSRMTT